MPVPRDRAEATYSDPLNDEEGMKEWLKMAQVFYPHPFGVATGAEWVGRRWRTLAVRSQSVGTWPTRGLQHDSVHSTGKGPSVVGAQRSASSELSRMCVQLANLLA